MTIITEHRLRRLFADRGYRVHEIRCNRHWWVKVERESGGPKFSVAVALTPSDFRFEYSLNKAIRKAERAASSVWKERAARPAGRRDARTHSASPPTSKPAAGGAGPEFAQHTEISRVGEDAGVNNGEPRRCGLPNIPTTGDCTHD